MVIDILLNSFLLDMECSDVKIGVKSKVLYKSSCGWAQLWVGQKKKEMEKNVDLVGVDSLVCKNEDAELCLVTSTGSVCCVGAKKRKKNHPKPL